MRNRINIVRVVGLVFIGAGLFLLSVSFPDLVSRFKNGYQSIWYRGLAGIALTGVTLTVAGLLGLLKHYLFRLIGNGSLVAGFFLFSYFYLFELVPDLRSEPLWLPAIFGVIGYGIIINFLLLLNNTHLLSALGEQDKYSKERTTDILDEDFE